MIIHDKSLALRQKETREWEEKVYKLPSDVCSLTYAYNEPAIESIHMNDGTNYVCKWPVRIDTLGRNPHDKEVCLVENRINELCGQF